MTRRIRHRSRSPYLDRLARHPLFADVPRHLVPMLGQALEDIVLPTTSRAVCRYGDVLVVAEGHGVLTRNGAPIAALGAGAVVATQRDAETLDCVAVVATAPLHCFLVPRRNVEGIRRIAPTIDRALNESATLARRAPTTGSFVSPVRQCVMADVVVGASEESAAPLAPPNPTVEKSEDALSR